MGETSGSSQNAPAKYSGGLEEKPGMFEMVLSS